MEFVLSWGAELTSLGALLISVASLFISFQMAKLKARLDYEVQTRVAEHTVVLTQQAQAKQIELAAFHTEVDSLLAAVASIQAVKNAINTVLMGSASPRSVSAPEAIEQMKQARRALDQAHEKFLALSNEVARDQLHKAKGRALQAQGSIVSSLGQSEYVPELDENASASLRSTVSAIGEIQDSLRDQAQRKQLEFSNASQAFPALDRG
ncbi:MAG: hypothetical protein R3C27_11330 [Hyphomonadaceae bacterium]